MPSLPLAEMLSAGASCCRALGLRAVLAVVDERGVLAAYLRMDGAFFVSQDLAVDKAWTAAGFRSPTAEVSSLLTDAPDTVRDGVLKRPHVSLVPGGLPLLQSGNLLGGVGVSGGSAEQDLLVAQAMVGVINA